MTTQYAVLQSSSGQAPTNTTLKMELFQIVDGVTQDVIHKTTDTVTELTNAKTQYVGTFGESAVIPAGNYFCLMSVIATGFVVASGDRTFFGVDGETAKPRAAELDSETRELIQEIHDHVTNLAEDLYIQGTGISGTGTTIVFETAGALSSGMLVPWILRLMGGCTHRISATSITVSLGVLSTVTATLETALLDDLVGGELITLYPDAHAELGTAYLEAIAAAVEAAINNENDGEETQQGIADKVVSTLVETNSPQIDTINSSVEEFVFGSPKPSIQVYVGYVNQQ